MRITLLLFILSIAVAGVQVVFAAAQTVAVLPSEGVLKDEELVFLTDKAQEMAVRVLPKSNFEVFPQEVIIKRLGGADSYVKECKESSCIVDLGKKAMVDYVAQCRFGKLDPDLTVTFELYNVRTSGLIDKFSERAKNVDGLLAIMQEKIPDGFMKIPGAALKGKVVLPPVVGGIRDLERAVDYEFDDEKRYLANISTAPQGAALSFNGIPDDKCSETPCKTEFPEGNVRIIARLEQYEMADTTVFIKQNNQNIAITLKPSFGVLEIEPVYSDGIGKYRQWNLKINDKPYSLGEIRLSPGNYAVKLNHECYENISFTAGIHKGKREVFDMFRNIVLKKGGLVLRAERNGEPASEPVFVNGRQVGETPFSGSVPLCAEIEIGRNRENVNVELKHNDEVNHKHIIRTALESEPPPYKPEPPKYVSFSEYKESFEQRMEHEQQETEAEELTETEEQFQQQQHKAKKVRETERTSPWLGSGFFSGGLLIMTNSFNTLYDPMGFIVQINAETTDNFIRIGVNLEGGFIGIDKDAAREKHPDMDKIDAEAGFFKLGAFARLYPTDFWYLSGGGGGSHYTSYSGKTKSGGKIEGPKTSVAVFSVGTGLIFFPSSESSLFIETQYNMLFNRNAGYLSISIGLRLRTEQK